MDYFGTIGGMWWQLAAVAVGVGTVGVILFFFVRRTKGDVVEGDVVEEEDDVQSQTPLSLTPSFTETITLPSRNKTVDVSWMRNDRQTETIVSASQGRGRIIFTFSALIVGILLLGSGGFFVWKSDVVLQEEHKESIATLAQNPPEPAQQQAENISEEEIPSAPSVTEQTSPASAPQQVSAKPENATVGVTVLNGGAAVGSASTVKGILVGKGYVKTDAANAKSTYSGEVVYYKSGFEASAKEIVTILSASYPKVSARADDAMAQAGGADIVVILGTPGT
ncbi:MAG TPA: LytR C-terminal domain-containing protein [Patescibacteria group bacterium]|nr:LytR C-terminal domain-containing protein [Patescibacteria group bacterium]